MEGGEGGEGGREGAGIHMEHGLASMLRPPVKRHTIFCHACPNPALLSTVYAIAINKKIIIIKLRKPEDCCVWRRLVRLPYYSVFVTNHLSKNTAISRFSVCGRGATFRTMLY